MAIARFGIVASSKPFPAAATPQDAAHSKLSFELSRKIPDDELVSRSKNGDSAAFGQIYSRYRKIAAASVRRTLNRHSAAVDDIVQESFIKAKERLGSFKGMSADGKKVNFYSWFSKIIFNCCMDFLRGQKRRTKADENFVESMRAQQDSFVSSNPERALLAWNEDGPIVRVLSSILDGRSQKSFQALFLNKFRGLSDVEVARELGCQPVTVRTNIFRAVKALRSELKSPTDG